MSDTLLIVEDDDGIRTSLRLAMEDEGYAVIEAATAEGGLALVPTHRPDVMLVDLMLGGIDGFTFIRKARATSDSPIVVISALTSTDDIVAALEAGADDYVTKPFQIAEITARLRALRRRLRTAAEHATAAPETNPDVMVLDGRGDDQLILDIGAGLVRRGNTEIHLTVTEFRLLSELAAPAGRVLSRQVLLERVWDRGYFGDDRIVDVHIRRLRTKIEHDPGNPDLVVTVRGLGYRLDTR